MTRNIEPRVGVGCLTASFRPPKLALFFGGSMGLKENGMRDKLGRFIKGHRGSPSTIKKFIRLSRKRWANKDFKERMSKIHMGEKSYLWKGGRYVDTFGYIHIYNATHPFAIRKHVSEHRLVMEKHLGRYLTRKEVVHHINEIEGDNRIENLVLFSNNIEHMKYHKRKCANKLYGGKGERK